MKLTPAQKGLGLAAVIVGMAAVGWMAWQFAGSESAPPAPPPPAAKVASPKSDPAIIQPQFSTPSAPPATPGAPNQLMTAEEGDQLIDEIIRSDKPTEEMARDLSALVQRTNGEAQVNVSRHLVNLTTDEDYGLIAGYLVDPKMNPEVIEVLFSDLMNRKRDLQLPLFMNILKNPQHPQNEQVRHVMTILASEDFGNDYAAWDRWAAEELRKIQSEE